MDQSTKYGICINHLTWTKRRMGGMIEYLVHGILRMAYIVLSLSWRHYLNLYMWTRSWAKGLMASTYIGYWAQTSLVFVSWKPNVILFMQLPCWCIWCEIEGLCGSNLRINITHKHLFGFNSSRIIKRDHCHIHCNYPKRDIDREMMIYQ